MIYLGLLEEVLNCFYFPDWMFSIKIVQAFSNYTKTFPRVTQKCVSVFFFVITDPSIFFVQKSQSNFLGRILQFASTNPIVQWENGAESEEAGNHPKSLNN
jgi:hypothetical protein